jgi:hypothetical protein
MTSQSFTVLLAAFAMFASPGVALAEPGTPDSTSTPAGIAKPATNAPWWTLPQGSPEREAARQEAARRAAELRQRATAAGVQQPMGQVAGKPINAAACSARFDAWAATLPKGTKVNRWDVDRAIGDGCSAVLISGAQKGADATDKCLERWKAAGDGNKVYDLQNPGVRQQIRRDIASAAGEQCADLLAR